MWNNMLVDFWCERQQEIDFFIGGSIIIYYGLWKWWLTLQKKSGTSMGQNVILALFEVLQPGKSSCQVLFKCIRGLNVLQT